LAKQTHAIEFKNDEIQVNRYGTTVHPVKYLHAEYDLNAERMVHFDGAIQYYPTDEYLIRRDSSFQQNVSHGDLIKANSEKAFKLNGTCAFACGIAPLLHLTAILLIMPIQLYRNDFQLTVWVKIQCKNGTICRANIQATALLLMLALPRNGSQNKKHASVGD